MKRRIPQKQLGNKSVILLQVPGVSLSPFDLLLFYEYLESIYNLTERDNSFGDLYHEPKIIRNQIPKSIIRYYCLVFLLMEGEL